MSDFETKVTAALPSSYDPTRHVNFTTGMVLGVDDFTQEFAYLSGRNQWLARDAIGYGTVRGLRVLVEEDGVNNPRVSVTPGAALSPRGQLICVAPEQCASLNAWLAEQQNDATRKKAFDAHVFDVSGTAHLRLYVTLCFDECLTEKVPVPGEPCRSEDNAMAFSRVQDDYRLRLSYELPAQFEDDGVRDFVRWLRLVPVDPAGTTTPEQLLAALRSALRLVTVPEPQATLGIPDASLRIRPQDAAAAWRAAFRAWVAELRPAQIGQGRFMDVLRAVIAAKTGGAPAGATPIAAFKVMVEAAAHLNDPAAKPGYLDDSVFDSLRIPRGNVDEYWQAAFDVWNTAIMPRWVSRGGKCAIPPQEGCLQLAELDLPLTTANPTRRVAGGASAVALSQERRPYLVHMRLLQEWLLSEPTIAPASSPTPAPAPATTVAPEVLPGLTQKVGTAVEYARADHSHGTPPDPIPTHKVDSAAHALAGDVTGTTGATSIANLQGRALVATSPQAGDILQFNGTRWVAANLPPTTGAFVARPDGSDFYKIAAAGHLRGGGDVLGGVSGGLTSQIVGDAVFMSFPSYKPGEPYVIKALLAYSVDEERALRLTAPVVSFERFGTVRNVAGFFLRVQDGGVRLKEDILSGLGFMVEVSQFARSTVPVPRATPTAPGLRPSRGPSRRRKPAPTAEAGTSEPRRGKP